MNILKFLINIISNTKRYFGAKENKNPYIKITIFEENNNIDYNCWR